MVLIFLALIEGPVAGGFGEDGKVRLGASDSQRGKEHPPALQPLQLDNHSGR